MSPDPTWKRFERRIAASLGVARTPLSGSNSRLTASDTLHPTLYVECKKRNRLAVYNWWLNAAHKATDEGKTPVLALHQFRGKHALAVISWDWFVDLLEAKDALQELLDMHGGMP